MTMVIVEKQTDKMINTGLSFTSTVILTICCGTYPAVCDHIGFAKDILEIIANMIMVPLNVTSHFNSVCQIFLKPVVPGFHRLTNCAQLNQVKTASVLTFGLRFVGP